MSSRKRIAIIGGGITGLAAAQRLSEQDGATQVTLYEASERLGGVIQSTVEGGFVFEHGADSFLVSDDLPWAGQLCEKLGVALIPTAAENRGALVLRGDKFHPIPDGLQLLSVQKLTSMMSTPLLSWAGKLRVAMELFVAKKTDSKEESLEEFATRRYGREMFERIIQPLVAGIYTADPKKLSVAAALPQFVALEQKYGSLTKAAASNKPTQSDRGARYGLFRSPRDGMQSLIDALERQLTELDTRKATFVKEIRKENRGWVILDGHQNSEAFDGVICATSAPAVSQLVRGFASDLARHVEAIECVSTAVVCLGFEKSQIRHPLNAFGCVIPSIENREIVAVSFTNVKFPTRAPEGHVLLRVFVGGALQPQIAELEDDALMQTVRQELKELFGVESDPLVSKIIRWPRGTPQYHLGHQKRVEGISAAAARLPGFEIAGNAYRGIGIPQCIREGWEAADRILNSSC